MDINIDSNYQGKRVDKVVESKLRDLGYAQSTRSMIKPHIDKATLVNNETVKPSYKLKQGDVLNIDEEYWKEFFLKIDNSSHIYPQKGDLDIIYEDEYLIVLFKPKGLVVHPGVGNSKDTLANYLKQYFQETNSLDSSMDRVGIVHRLDKGVSGVMVVAKNKEVQNKLKEQFANRVVRKIYLANVESFKSSELHIDKEYDLEEILEIAKDDNLNLDNWFKASGYIGRNRSNRFKMEFKLYEFGGSKRALSYILPISKDSMLIKIETGRMHQIRATLFYYGYHIIGDKLYSPGSREVVSEEIMLQSIYLSFIHPVSNKRMHFVRL